MANNKVEYTLSLNDLMTNKIKGAEAATDRFERKVIGVGTALKEMAIGAGLAFGAVGLTAFVQDSIKAYDDQEQALAQLHASLISTGNAAGVSESALIKQAEALQKTRLFADEVTEGAQSLLLTFTNIRGEILMRTTPAIQDMATKMHLDLNQAAIQVGKALNDPIKGIMALRRVGVSFSQGQMDVIKRLVETNKVADAQVLILQELEKEFGGSADAAAKAGTGPMKLIQQQFDETKESVGGLAMRLIVHLKPAIEGIIKAVDGFVVMLGSMLDWISQNKEVVEVLAIGIGAYLVVTNAAAIATGIWSAATYVMTAAQWALNAAMDANPIGVMILAITGITAAVIYAWKHFAGFRGAVLGAWEVLKGLVGFVKDWVINVFSGLADVVAGVFTLDPDRIQSGLNKAVSAYAQFGKSAADAFNKGYTNGITSFNQDNKTTASPAEVAKPAGQGKPQQVDLGYKQPKMKPTNSPRIVTINMQIGSLMKDTKINVNNIKNMSAQEIKDIMVNALTGAINDSQVIAGS